jgi:hypothetical protein
MSRKHMSGAICVAASLGSGAALAGPAANLELVAMHGDAAGGGVIFGFSHTMLGGGSRIAYRSPISGVVTGSPALFLRGSGLVPAEEMGGSGAVAPDLNGTISNISPAIAAASSRVAFYSDLTGTADGFNDNSAIFRSAGGSPQLISREGQSAAGNGEFLTWTVPLINDSGNVAFTAILRDTAAGELDNRAIYLGDASDALNEIVREGDASPDGNGFFLFLDYPALNNANEVSFRADLRDTASGALDNAGLFRGTTGGVDALVRKGDAAPDANGTFDFFSSQSMDGNGDVAFYAELAGTASGDVDDSGVFVATGALVAQIAREGAPEPGGNGEFAFFYDPVIVGGYVVFAAELRNTAAGDDDNYGVYRHDGVTLELVLRKGDSAPGTTGGVFIDTCDPIVSANGQVAVIGDVDVIDGVEDGVWATTPSGALVPVVVVGDSLEVAPGIELEVWGAQHVSHFYGYLSGGEDGHCAFDADGRLALRVTFTDWTRAVYIAQLPITLCAEDCEPPQGDHDVTVADVMAIVTAFGTTGESRFDVAPVNVDHTIGDEVVSVRDIVAAITAYGPCTGN